MSAFVVIKPTIPIAEVQATAAFVLAINAAMVSVEVMAGVAAGSASLQAISSAMQGTTPLACSSSAWRFDTVPRLRFLRALPWGYSACELSERSSGIHSAVGFAALALAIWQSSSLHWASLAKDADGDLIVAAIIATVALQGAWVVISQSRVELRGGPSPHKRRKPAKPLGRPVTK
jgi:hypothetical protein